MDEAYLKDYDAAQEFGFCQTDYEKLFVRSKPQMQQNPHLAGFGVLHIG